MAAFSMAAADSRPATRPSSVSDVGQSRIHYDADLTWTVSNFAGQLFADGSLLTRSGHEGTSETLMATGLPTRFQDHLAATLKQVSAYGRVESGRRFAEQPLHSWSECLVSGEVTRVLSIAFAGEGERFEICLLYSAKSDVERRTAETIAGQILPGLVGPIRLWSKLQNERTRIAGLENALDAQGVGIGILDCSGAVTFMNAAMRRWVETGEGLRRHGSTLVATDLASAVKFQVAITHVLSLAGALSYDAWRPATLVPLRRARGIVPMLAAITPVTRVARDSRDVAAVIHILDPAVDGARMLKPVCNLYGLSPVETALVMQLVDGQTLGEAAVQLRVKETTARSYLKQVFQKTSVNRQSSLIKLMLTSAFRLGQNFAPVVL